MTGDKVSQLERAGLFFGKISLMLLRLFLKSGNDCGVLVVKAEEGFERKDYFLTEIGKIDKRLIQEWQVVEEGEESGQNRKLPPLL